MHVPKTIQRGNMPTRVLIQNQLEEGGGYLEPERLAFDVLLPLPEQHLEVLPAAPHLNCSQYAKVPELVVWGPT